MDKMYIVDLEVYANHGVFIEEQKLGQMFLVSIELDLNLRNAGKSDDLNESISYASICDEVTEVLQKDNFHLIEKCAEEVAKFLLFKYNNILNIKVMIKKPWAPIGKSLNYAAVEINRGWHDVFVGVGSNLGERENNINLAIESLIANEIKLISSSTIIETVPVSDVEQTDFLNCVLHLKTILPVQELMQLLLQIEEELKRVRVVKWGPRTIDLDILLYDHDIYEFNEAIVPHPLLHKRLFVLEPLCELIPNYIHPILNKRLIEIKNDLVIND